MVAMAAVVGSAVVVAAVLGMAVGCGSRASSNYMSKPRSSSSTSMGSDGDS